jgi:hypothetical protein
MIVFEALRNGRHKRVRKKKNKNVGFDFGILIFFVFLDEKFFFWVEKSEIFEVLIIGI